MTYTVLLDFNSNKRAVEDEEKAKFIRSILEAMNIEVDFWSPQETTLTIETKIKLRELLSELGLIILETTDGEVEIYFEQKLIGEWRKPFYMLKKDLSQVDPRKKLYLEMHVTFSSPLFEEQV